MDQKFIYILALIAIPILLFGSDRDSIFSRLNHNPTPEKRVELYIDLSGNYINESLNDSAYYYARQAIQYSRENGLRESEAMGFYALAYAYDLAGNLEEALVNYESARRIYSELDIKSEVATCMNSKGVAAYFKGDYEQALFFYLETLEYAEKFNIQSVMPNTLNNLGVIYRITSKHREAIITYQKTLELSKSSSNKNMIATSFHNLGVAFNFTGILDSSLIYFDSALYQYELLNDTFEIGRTSTAIGEAYYLTAKDNDKARPYLEKGAYYLQWESNQEELSKTYLLMAQVESDDGNFRLSIEHFERGLGMVEGTDREDLILDYYQEMAACYQQFKQPEPANNYLIKYVELYKKVQSTEKLLAIEELQTKYESQEKDKEIALQEIIILKNKRQHNILFAGLLFFFLLSAFIYHGIKRKHAFDVQLAQREKEIQMQKIQKMEQEQKILALDYMLMGEEKERKRIAKELHDSLGSLLTSAKLQLYKTSRESDTEKDASSYAKAESIIAHAADEVRRISHAMMPEALVNLGLQAAIEDLAGSIHSSDKIQVATQFFDLNESTLSSQHQVGIYRIIQELTQNVIKHSEATKMIIQLTQEHEILLLEVEDDGVGFDLANSVIGNGIGLRNIESRVKYLDGTLQIDTRQGGPTIFTIEFPTSPGTIDQ